MDIGPLLLSLFLTIIAYMIFPIIKLLTNRGKFERKRARKIALLNSIVVGGIFSVITFAVSEPGATTWNAAPATLYYLINRAILTDKNAKPTPKVQSCENKPETTTMADTSEQKVSNEKHTQKAPFLVAVYSALLVPLLIIVHIVAENLGVDNAVFYVITDSLAFFVSPAVFSVSLTVLLYNHFNRRRSVKNNVTEKPTNGSAVFEAIYSYKKATLICALVASVLTIGLLIGYFALGNTMYSANLHYEGSGGTYLVGCGTEICTYCQGIQLNAFEYKGPYSFPYYSSISNARSACELLAAIFGLLSATSIACFIIVLIKHKKVLEDFINKKDKA